MSKLEKLIQYVSVFVGVLVLVYLFLFRVVIVKGDSMEPTLESGNVVVVDVFTHKREGFQRGKIVVLRRDDAECGGSCDYVKRVIGLPGDVVSIRDGYVYVNGKLISEEYLFQQGSTKSLEEVYEVYPGSLFVLGDNRLSSEDSRSWGTVDVSRVMGQVVHVFR